MAEHSPRPSRRGEGEPWGATAGELLSTLLDSIPVGVYGVDEAGRCTFANRACLRMLGYRSSEQLVGQRLHDLVHHTRPSGDPYPLEECPLYRATVEGRQIHLDDELLWRRDGSSFPAEHWFLPIFREERCVGGIACMVDTSERKRGEEALRRSSDERTQLARRLARLQRVTAALSRAATVEHVADVVVDEGKTAAQAAMALVRARTAEHETADVAASSGVPADAAEAVLAALPSELAGDEAELWLSSSEELRALGAPAGALAALGVGSAAILPLGTGAELGACPRRRLEHGRPAQLSEIS